MRKQTYCEAKKYLKERKDQRKIETEMKMFIFILILSVDFKDIIMVF
jgi:hypothetical protein